MSEPHLGYVDEDGELSYERPDVVARHLEGLKGKRVKVTIKRSVPIRSIDQNALYWGGVIAPAASQTGNDMQDIHEALKEMHLVPEVREILGKQRVTYSTTGLSIMEFSEYIEKCKATLTQFGVSLE